MKLYLVENLTGLEGIPMFQVFWDDKEAAEKEVRGLLESLIEKNFPEDKNGQCFVEIMESWEFDETDIKRYKETNAFWNDEEKMQAFEELGYFLFWKPTDEQIQKLKELLKESELPREIALKGPNNRTRIEF